MAIPPSLTILELLNIQAFSHIGEIVKQYFHEMNLAIIVLEKQTAQGTNPGPPVLKNGLTVPQKPRKSSTQVIGLLFPKRLWVKPVS